jgi:catechol 2,3-dioxygenase-like lactoylglutathione lyase family enzyme
MLGTNRFVGFLLVTDASRSRHFYCDVLGLPLVHQDDFAIVLDAGGTQLRLAIVPTVPEPAGTNAGWLVDDIHATVSALAAAGVEFERFPSMDQDDDGVWHPTPDAGGVAWFSDPDGNRLSLTESRG